jgi:hypothetical protein
VEKCGKERGKSSSVGSLLAVRSTPRDGPSLDGFLLLLAARWWREVVIIIYLVAACDAREKWTRQPAPSLLSFKAIHSRHTHALLFIMEINKISSGICVQSRAERKNGRLLE